MNTGIESCYEAFDRLKAGKPQVEKFKGLLQKEITASVVSQEAGFDGGYLKKKRRQHQPLISMIALYVKEHHGTTMGKGAELLREKKKVKDAKANEALMQTQRDASLGRELQLYHALKESEEKVIKLEFELAKINNVTRLPM